jgi:cytochrome c5
MKLKNIIPNILFLCLIGCSTAKVVKAEQNSKPNKVVLSAQNIETIAVVEEKLNGKNLYENNCAKCQQF